MSRAAHSREASRSVDVAASRREHANRACLLGLERPQCNVVDLSGPRRGPQRREQGPHEALVTAGGLSEPFSARDPRMRHIDDMQRKCRMPCYDADAAGAAGLSPRLDVRVGHIDDSVKRGRSAPPRSDGIQCRATHAFAQQVFGVMPEMPQRRRVPQPEGEQSRVTLSHQAMLHHDVDNLVRRGKCGAPPPGTSTVSRLRITESKLEHIDIDSHSARRTFEKLTQDGSWQLPGGLDETTRQNFMEGNHHIRKYSELVGRSHSVATDLRESFHLDEREQMDAKERGWKIVGSWSRTCTPDSSVSRTGSRLRSNIVQSGKAASPLQSDISTACDATVISPDAPSSCSTPSLPSDDMFALDSARQFQHLQDFDLLTTERAKIVEGFLPEDLKATVLASLDERIETALENLRAERTQLLDGPLSDDMKAVVLSTLDARIDRFVAKDLTLPPLPACWCNDERQEQSANPWARSRAPTTHEGSLDSGAEAAEVSCGRPAPGSSDPLAAVNLRFNLRSEVPRSDLRASSSGASAAGTAEPQRQPRAPEAVAAESPAEILAQALNSRCGKPLWQGCGKPLAALRTKAAARTKRKPAWQ